MARTDNDTWNLASSVGATATAVAASRAIASQGPGALLDDPWAGPLVRAVGVETFIKAYAAHGFSVPDDELASFGDASGYLSGVYAGRA